MPHIAMIARRSARLRAGTRAEGGAMRAADVMEDMLGGVLPARTWRRSGSK